MNWGRLLEQRGWLCFYKDDDADGRFTLGTDYTAKPSDNCPTCGYAKTQWGCRWVTITDA